MVGYDALNVKYTREKGIAHILNECLLHLLRTHSKDPVAALLTFLQSAEGQHRVHGKARAQKLAKSRQPQPYVPPAPPKPAGPTPDHGEPKYGSLLLLGPGSGSTRNLNLLQHSAGEGHMVRTESLAKQLQPVAPPASLQPAARKKLAKEPLGPPCAAPTANGGGVLHGAVLPGGVPLHDGCTPAASGRGLAALGSAAQWRHATVHRLLHAYAPRLAPQPSRGLAALESVAETRHGAIGQLCTAARPLRVLPKGYGLELLITGQAQDRPRRGITHAWHASGQADPAEVGDAALGRPLLCGGLLPGGGFLNDGVVGAPVERGAALAHLLGCGGRRRNVALLGQGELTGYGYVPYVPQEPLKTMLFGGALPGGSFLNDGVAAIPPRPAGDGLAALLSVTEPMSKTWVLRAGDGLATLAAAPGAGGAGIDLLLRSGRLLTRELLCGLASDTAPQSLIRHLAMSCSAA